jgi:serine protease DegQ
MPAARPEPGPRARPVPALAPALALALALLAVLAGCDVAGRPQARSIPAPVTAAQVSSSAQAAAAVDIPGIVRKVEPSVVTIFVGQGLGSGVVWAEDGTLVTNHHVVESAMQSGGEVEVGFADGRRVAGRVRASDPITDLAVVQAERTGVPAATFQRNLPVVGELAVAIGSPLGLENTVTAGIISGLHREIPGANQQALVDLLQTDAAISPGNSGGALVNGRGEIIGINEAYLHPISGAVSLGFAIPSTTVVDVVTQLLENGRASHAFLGIEPAAITPQISALLGLDRTEGVVVLSAEAGGPAAEAGIQPGDVLTQLGDRRLEGVEDLLDELRQRKAGDQVEITLVRGGREQKVRVTLTERPPG